MVTFVRRKEKKSPRKFLMIVVELDSETVPAPFIIAAVKMGGSFNQLTAF